MDETYRQIQEDIRKLKDDLAAAATQATADTGVYAAVARERARQKLHEAERKLRQSGQQADAYVHEHSWLVIMVTAIVGVLLGALFSRGRRS